MSGHAPAHWTRDQVAEHNSRRSARIIIDNVVYDVTEFLEEHPGGSEVLLDNAGKDASQCFHDVGHSEIALDWRQKFVVGEVVESERREVITREATPQQLEEPLTLAGLLAVWGPPLALAALAAVFYAYLFP